MKNHSVTYKNKNISSFSVKDYSFKATLDQSLLKKHLKALGLVQDLEVVYELQGEFSIEWDDDIPMPVLECLYIVNPLKPDDSIEIDLDRCFNHKYLLFDGYDIEDRIANSGLDLDWCSDREASLADYYYDQYKDSL